MKHKLLLLLLNAAALLLNYASAQHEDIPYQPVTQICQTCVCLSVQDSNHRLHQTLNCATKNFEHILARWPSEFGTQHTGMEIVSLYSGNNIKLLQQLPATNATVTFACNHCGIMQMQAPLFMDVPHVESLFLAWNKISDNTLQPELFRGPFNGSKYEPIGLRDLDLSHNSIARLDAKLFEYTPELRKLALAYNRLSVLDATTTAALASIAKLQRLDLSYNGLVTLPSDLFAKHNELRSLDLSGNKLATVSASIQQLGATLQQLSLMFNPIIKLEAKSFQQLQALRRLNISDMPLLRSIEQGALQLRALEQLDCKNNPKLERLEFNDLQQSRNLTTLDLSGNGLSTLNLNVSSNSSAALWPRLRSLSIATNPWDCSCELLQALEQAGAPKSLSPDSVGARCDTPYLLAGAPLHNLTATQICSMVIPKKYMAVDDDPPRFLRRRYVILTVIIASIVVVLGLIIGFIVVCIRRRLKGSDYGVQPIRYTSVRGSNLSAFSQLQPASVTSKFNNAAAATATTAGAGAANSNLTGAPNA
ncbi:CG7702 [Drosophila busckii]|uniref:CG7702 n=1 Tax=Drosophila busckii TaxID=30019 RepID=A0A0M3QXV9_DROBS|nr:leucine-rich alpha-2-glycoprotein [Drosophila busckii]ALC46603.1 CG7702 [Drosophila busckii]